MNNIEITRVEDVRAGDRVTLTRNGTTVSGTVRDVTHGDTNHCFYIASLQDILIVGDGGWTLVNATREVPGLPTEPGSVIVNATIRGEAGHTAILNTNGDWFTTTHVEGYWCHTPEHVTEWEPARVVHEGD